MSWLSCSMNYFVRKNHSVTSTDRGYFQNQFQSPRVPSQYFWSPGHHPLSSYQRCTGFYLPGRSKLVLLQKNFCFFLFLKTILLLIPNSNCSVCSFLTTFFHADSFPVSTTILIQNHLKFTIKERSKY